MVNIKKFPRGIEEARAQLKVPSSNSDQVISKEPATAGNQRAPGPGLKLRHGGLTPEASGHKPQAPGSKLQASSFRTNLFKHQAASFKPRGTSFKRQATSCKLRDT